jgi:hypothetical protein
VPDLHAPGAVRITALDDLLTQKPAPQISDLAAYVGPGPGLPLHLLVHVDQQLYDVDVERQRARLLDDAVACTRHIAVSLDSAWAACPANDGIRIFQLPPIATANNPLGDQLVLPNEANYDEFYSPTWGPNGSSLAVLRHQSDKPPAIAAYTVPVAHDTLRPSAEIELANVPQPAAIAWSPDGAWLHLLETIGYLLPARHLLTHPGTPTIDPQHVDGAIIGAQACQ